MKIGYEIIVQLVELSKSSSISLFFLKKKKTGILGFEMELSIPYYIASLVCNLSSSSNTSKSNLRCAVGVRACFLNNIARTVKQKDKHDDRPKLLGSIKPRPCS